jgi:hypothetical protein
MNNNIRVNTSELKGGVYFISFENESGVIRTDKFVKSVK